MTTDQRPIDDDDSRAAPELDSAGIDLFGNPPPAEPPADAEDWNVTRLGETLASLDVLVLRLRATADHTGRVAHTGQRLRTEDVAALAARLREYRSTLELAIEDLRDVQQDLAGEVRDL